MGLELQDTKDGDEELVVWYAPDFLGNLDLPEDQRAMIGYKPMSATKLMGIEVSSLLKRGEKKTKVKRNQDVLVAITKREIAKREATIKAGAVGVRNWSRNTDGVSTEIKTWEELHTFLLAWKKHGAAVNLMLSDLYNRIMGETVEDEETLGE